MSATHPRAPWLDSILPSPTGASVRVSPIVTGLLSLLLLIPAFVYYQTIDQTAYNFPYEDDFNSALSFISDYAFGKTGFSERLALIFSQYNEHRIVFDRLVFLADFGLFGKLDFRHLVLVGNLSLVGIAILFAKAAFPHLTIRQKLIYLLPAAYSLFLFHYWELSTWSMAALQNLYVVPFAMLSLYSLPQPRKETFGLASVMAVLAAFTSGNGIFTFMAGAFVLLLLTAYRRLAIWMVLGALTATVYFWGYIRPPYHPDVVDSLVNHTGRAIAYFFTLTGMLAGSGRPRLALAFGVLSLLVTLGLLGFLWYKNRFAEHITLIGWLVFLYLTCLSLMATRSGMGVGQATTPRYGIVVVMLFATQATLLMEVIQHRTLRLGIWLGCLGIVLFTYLSATNQDNQRRIYDRTRTLQYNSALYNQNPTLISLHWGNAPLAKTIFKTALQQQIYQVPTTTFHDLNSRPSAFDSAPLQDTHTVTADVQPYEIGPFLVFYRFPASLATVQPRRTTVRIVAQSATTSYAFDTQPHAWDDPDDHTLGGRYRQPGFSCVIDKRDLKPGQYRLWLFVTDDQTNGYLPLEKTLNR